MNRTRPLRIAFVTPGFSADDSDWCIPILQNLACRFAEFHDLRVYTCSYPGHSSDYRVKGVRVRAFGNGRGGRLAELSRLRRTLRAVEQDHRERPFDVVHGFWADSGGLIAAVAGRRLGIRSILTVMGGELIYEPLAAYGKRLRPVAGYFARYAARRATTVNVSSAYHRERILAEQTRIVPAVIPLGTDTRLFNERVPALRLAGEVPVLCVGSLVTVKGHRLVLDAFARVSVEFPQLHLHLVGQGGLDRALRGEVSRQGLATRVTMHGHVAHHELPAWYRGASFCVLGSLFENHGMTILEAAACGRVTVGSEVGLMRELCPAHLLAEPGNGVQLAQALRQAAATPAALEQYARHLSCIVRASYSLESTAAAFEAIYAATGHET